MSFTWTREMQHHSSEGQNGYPLWIKQMVMQLYHLCGFTNFSHSSGAGWDPTTFNKNGTNGSFTGSSKRFTDTTASAFDTSDTDSYILIKDTTNPKNNGWYKMTYVDANNVDLDFRSAAAEYPVSASGLSWWILTKGSSYPSGTGNYCRIRSPKGWEIEFENYWWINQWQRSSTDIRISLNADWTASGQIVGPWRVGWGSGYINGEPENVTRFMLADTEGDTLFFWFNYSVAGGWYGFLIAPSDPYEATPARTAIEKYAMAGTGYNDGDSGTGTNRLNWRASTLDTNYLGVGLRHWNRGVSRQLYRVEYSYWDATRGFAGDTTAEANARTGNWDILLGVMMFADLTDANGEYAPFAPIGAVNESMFTVPGWNVGIGERAVVDYGGTDNDCYHITNSIGVAWPKGITPQF